MLGYFYLKYVFLKINIIDSGVNLTDILAINGHPDLVFVTYPI